MALATKGLIHTSPYTWVYADAAARTAATGFTADDIGGWAIQLDDGTLWELTATTPTWAQRGGGGTAAPSGPAGGVLSGTYPDPGFAADMATQAELDAHTGDTTAAHAATAIAFTPNGSIAATDVQAAIQEVRDEAAGAGGSVATDAIWDAAGDLAVGSGANTAAKLAMGTALQQLRVNAGATALEWATPAGGGGGGAFGAVLWPRNSRTLSGPPFTTVNTGGVTYFYQDGPNPAAWEQVFTIAAGTYTFKVTGRTGNFMGIADWTLDGAAMVTGQDWYAATGADDVTKTASVTIATGGEHTLRMTLNGKNASSSNYYLELEKMWFTP